MRVYLIPINRFKHHLNNSRNSSRKRTGFGEVTGKVVGVSKMSVGNNMQERYNHVIHVSEAK
jgi:hypothetical protein